MDADVANQINRWSLISLLTLTILGERQPMTIEVRAAKMARGSVALMTMIATEDRTRVNPGFQLIRRSLRLK